MRPTMKVSIRQIETRIIVAAFVLLAAMLIAIAFTVAAIAEKVVQ